jgi:uncharacterized protein (DUF1800 family)
MPTTEGPWAEYRPTADDPWDLRKVAHLHRRAGLGATWGELQRDLKEGPAASVDRLLRPRTPNEEEKDALAALRQGVIDSRDGERLKAWWLYRLLWDPDPLREKLTLFWHGHFATSNRKVQSIPLMLAQNELLRKHALEEFGPLVTDIISDGAMLIWLDGAGSNKQKPNENFGREFLELFTLGIGHYKEKDLREAARAFTGWVRTGGNQFSGEAPSFRFDAANFDDKPKTFLGQTGDWKPADIVRITLEQPTCAEFLCKKLYRFLVSEAVPPPAELIGPLAEELRKGRYTVRQVVQTILRSKHFFGSAAYRQRVKCPVEFSTGLVRLLDVPRDDVRLLALAVACDREGQELFAPPNVKGWDGGRTWINSTTILERGNWVTHLVWGDPNLGMKPFDVAAWGKRNGIAPDKTLDALVDLVLQNDLGDKARALVRNAGQDGKPDSLRKALQLLLNCAEFQLA